MKDSQNARVFQKNHPRLVAIATGFVLVGSLLVVPSSTSFAQAAETGPNAARAVVPLTPWRITGNSGTNPSTNFLGTTDNKALVLRTDNVEALRILAGDGSTGGNVGIGTTSPGFRLDVNGDINTSTRYDLAGTTVLQTPGQVNTFVGPFAGNANSTGGNNTASGYQALATITTGFDNNASGQASLRSNTTGSFNTASGAAALISNTTGSSNTAVGYGAGATPIDSSANANTTGSNNTFVGFEAGPGSPTQLTNATAIGANATVNESNALVLGGTGPNAVKVGIGTISPIYPFDVSGDINTSTKYDIGGVTVLQAPGGNIFVGHSGNSNTTGVDNTAVGSSGALRANTTGNANTAVGSNALQANTAGLDNTASGASALQSNTTGDANTATGTSALSLNTTGRANTSTGTGALALNTTGANNTVAGFNAGGSNTSGGNNTVAGTGALFFNTTGGNNTAVGFNAGNGAPNTSNTNTTGSNNTFIGSGAGPGTPTQLTNATAVGANATVNESNAVVLGGTGANIVNVGIGTQTPQSTLQVASNGAGYGNYLQIPIVKSVSGPPASDCNSTTLAGRMVLQDNTGAITLWVCSASMGTWVAK